MLMMILQVDGNMVITTLRNKYYNAQVLLLFLLVAQFIGGAKYKLKLASVLLKVSTLLIQPQQDN